MILDHFQANLSQLLIDFYPKLVVLPCIFQEIRVNLLYLCFI